MFLVGFKPTILASEWSQTNTLDQAITGIGLKHMLLQYIVVIDILMRQRLD